MRLSQTLEDAQRRGLRERCPMPDLNLELLVDRLQRGDTIERATIVEESTGPLPGPSLILSLKGRGGTSLLPVGLGPGLDRLAGTPVGSTPEPDLRGDLLRDVRTTLQGGAHLTPEERAARLMDLLMERLDARRCALVPFESGTPGEPLAFHLRGGAHRAKDARRLPSRVLSFVGSTRQPLVADDVESPSDPLGHAGTIGRLGIRSYMATPVVFRGDLLAVMYLDRYDRPRAFAPDEVAAFEAVAHEAARPLLAVREQQRRRDYDQLLEGFLSGARPQATPRSGAMARVLEEARRAATATDEHLLLLGETGVGKEWLARHVHEASRRTGAFVAVNVAAIPGELFETELMGSARGAFTGAVDRPGLVAVAERGTLFLDEIGDLDPAAQVRLLRFLQDRRVRSVGQAGEREADVRIVAATNRRVWQMAESGTFRSDLLHRFAPPLLVPPLRERREEIEDLARSWCVTKARQRGVAVPSLSADALTLLREHHWPGNIRQLQMVLSHAIATVDGAEITAATLRPLLDVSGATSTPLAPAATWAGLQESFRTAEREWLRQALQAEGGNVEAVARRAGIARTTLRRLLNEHGLASERPAPPRGRERDATR